MDFLNNSTYIVNWQPPEIPDAVPVYFSLKLSLMFMFG